MGVYIEVEKPKENIWSVELIYRIEDVASLMSIAETVEPTQVIEIDLVRCGECKYQFSCGHQIKRNGLTLKLTCCEYGERRSK